MSFKFTLTFCSFDNSKNVWLSIFFFVPVREVNMPNKVLAFRVLAGDIKGPNHSLLQSFSSSYNWNNFMTFHHLNRKNMGVHTLFFKATKSKWTLSCVLFQNWHYGNSLPRPNFIETSDKPLLLGLWTCSSINKNSVPISPRDPIVPPFGCHHLLKKRNYIYFIIDIPNAEKYKTGPIGHTLACLVTKDHKKQNFSNPHFCMKERKESALSSSENKFIYIC